MLTKVQSKLFLLRKFRYFDGSRNLHIFLKALQQCPVMPCHVFVFSHFSSALCVLLCLTLLLCQTTSYQVSLPCDYLPHSNVLHLCPVVSPLLVYFVYALTAFCASLSLSLLQVFQHSSPPVSLLVFLFFFFDFASALPLACLPSLTPSCVLNLPVFIKDSFLEPEFCSSHVFGSIPGVC